MYYSFPLLIVSFLFMFDFSDVILEAFTFITCGSFASLVIPVILYKGLRQIFPPQENLSFFFLSLAISWLLISQENSSFYVLSGILWFFLYEKSRAFFLYRKTDSFLHLSYEENPVLDALKYIAHDCRSISLRNKSGEDGAVPTKQSLWAYKSYVHIGCTTNGY